MCEYVCACVYVFVGVYVRAGVCVCLCTYMHVNDRHTCQCIYPNTFVTTGLIKRQIKRIRYMCLTELTRVLHIYNA